MAATAFALHPTVEEELKGADLSKPGQTMAVPGTIIQISGDARVRGIWQINYDLDSDVDVDNRYWDQRARFNVDAATIGGVELRTRLTLSTASGSKSGQYAWDGTLNGQDVTWDWAYLHIPVGGISVDVGNQRSNWGLKFFTWDTPKDRLKVNIPAGPGTLVLFTDKDNDTFNEIVGTDNLTDKDSYGVAYVGKAGDLTVGAIGIYTNDATPTVDASGFAVDAYLNGPVGPVGLAAEVVYKGGDLNENAAGDSRYGGFVLATLGLDVATIGGAIAFTDNGYVADNDWTPTLFFGTLQPTAMLNYGQGADSMLTGLVFASFKAGDAGTATVKAAYVDVSEWAANGQDGNLAEIDAGYTHQITKNINLDFGVGYLMPGGDAFDGTDNATAVVLSTNYTF
jgi:hypothetical protein